MERVRESFNVNGPALAACEAALGDEAHLQWSLHAQRRASAPRWATRCATRGLRVLPVADQLRAGRVRHRTPRWSRPRLIAQRRGAAADGRLRACRLPAHHRRRRARRTGACWRPSTRCWRERSAACALDGAPRSSGLSRQPCACRATSRFRIARSCWVRSPKALPASAASWKARTRAPRRGCSSQLGVRIEAPSAGERIVHGVGLHGLRGSDAPA